MLFQAWKEVSKEEIENCSTNPTIDLLKLMIKYNNMNFIDEILLYIAILK